MYGGTFDPPHLGHLHCVESLKKVLPGLSRCVVVPHPTIGLRKKAVASFFHRLAMCRLLFKGLSFVEVSPMEENLAYPYYTLHTLEQIKSQVPHSPLGLLMGEDQNVFSWHKPQEILKLAKIFVIPRGQKGTHKAQSSLIRKNFGVWAKDWLGEELYDYILLHQFYHSMEISDR